MLVTTFQGDVRGGGTAQIASPDKLFVVTNAIGMLDRATAGFATVVIITTVYIIRLLIKRYPSRVSRACRIVVGGPT